MAFIPKIILLDKGTNKHEFEAYDILAQRSGGATADNMVKQYITLNPNHEFVQYLFSASDEDGYNIYGFVVKVPYDIDTDKIAELTTPLVDGYTELNDNSKGGTKRRKRGRKRGTKRRS
jgi:hypothetical protein